LKKIYYFILLLFLKTALFANTNIEQHYFIDKDARYTTKNIYENRDKFSPLERFKSGFGLQNRTIWLYVKCENNSDAFQSNIIEFPYPLLDYIEVLEYADGALRDNYLTGDLTNFSTRKESSNMFVIPYELGANETKEFIFKVNSEGALNLKMNFYSKSDYFQEAKYNLMNLGIYYGAVLIMLIYNLLLYFMIRERVYLYYVLFHFEYLFLQLGLNGLAFEHFWPNTPEINSYYILFMLALSNYLSIPFSMSFLNVKELHKNIYTYFKFLKIIFILIMVLNFAAPYNLVAKAVALFSILSVGSLFVSGIYILVKDKTVSAKFFVSAWSFLLVGVLLTEFQNVGILPISFLTLYGTQIGAFIELGLLSLALAHRYNTVFVKLTKTEAELRILNEELELKVVERTKNLDEKNRELNKEVNNKNVLLRELFHRVKNNLQIISGLLSLQSNRIEDKKTKEIFKDTIHRIKSMALIHEKMYQSDNLELVNIQEYVKSLIEETKSFIKGSDIRFSVACENIGLKIETAVPIGLILNEIITNLIKYAFDADAHNKLVSIKMYIDSDEKLIIKIKDNGRGIEFEGFKKGLGFKLIESLIRHQLKGDFKYFNENGLNYIMTFNKENIKVLEIF
jgi:two-component sensor histidine kinase